MGEMTVKRPPIASDGCDVERAFVAKEAGPVYTLAAESWEIQAC